MLTGVVCDWAAGAAGQPADKKMSTPQDAKNRRVCKPHLRNRFL